MDIETEIIKEYKEYITKNSIFKDVTILPSAPQSFSKFPTIIIREASNSQNIGSTSMDLRETSDNLVYQITIYAKNAVVDNKKYQARDVVRTLRLLTCNFFMNCGFTREEGRRSDYVDLSIHRYILLFSGTINNWNNLINN